MLLCPEMVIVMLLVFCTGKMYGLCTLLFGGGRRMQCIGDEGIEISRFGRGRAVCKSLLGLNFRE